MGKLDRVDISRRLSASGSAWRQSRWFKWVLGAYALIGAYDLFGSQFAPDWLSHHMPPIKKMIEATSNWLPWWAWGWIGTGILLCASLEYAVRPKAQDGGTASDSKSAPPSLIPRPLTPYEREQQLKVCDEVADFIQRHMTRVVPDGNQLANDIWNQFKARGDAYIESCEDYGNDVRSLGALMESMRKKWPHHPDITSVLPLASDMTKMWESVAIFVRILKGLKNYDLTATDFFSVTERAREDFYGRVLGFAKSRMEAEKYLSTLHQKTSTSP